MRLLLPPSESKNDGRQRSALAVQDLSRPELSEARTHAVDALQRLSLRPKAARLALGLSEKQDFERQRNCELWTAQTSTAAEIYCGVLYDALDIPSLTAGQKTKAAQSLLIQSALFGWLAIDDAIPAYRLSGDCTLPRIGAVSQWWRKHLDETLREETLIVDLRSGIYAKFWQPRIEQLQQSVTIKVMQLVTDGKESRKIAVSHFNKATKGRVTRDLLRANTKVNSIEDIGDVLAKRGWRLELHAATERSPHILEVLIDQV